MGCREMGGSGRKNNRRMNEWERASLKSCLTLKESAVQRKRLTAFNASGWTSADDRLYNGLSGIDWQVVEAPIKDIAAAFYPLNRQTLYPIVYCAWSWWECRFAGIQPDCGARCKVRGGPRWWKFIMRGTRMEDASSGSHECLYQILRR